MRRTGIRNSKTETITNNCRMCPAHVRDICPDEKVFAAPYADKPVRQHVVGLGQAVPSYAPDWHQIAVLKSGVVRLQTFTQEGRRHIVSLVLPGEILSAQRLRGMTQESVTQSVICIIDKTTQEAGARIVRALYRQNAIQLKRVRFMTYFIGVLTAEERICAFLAMSLRFLPLRQNPDGSLQLTMLLCRTDLADLLGTTQETISRVTHRLQNEGILAINGATGFSILDRTALAKRGKIARPEISDDLWLSPDDLKSSIVEDSSLGLNQSHDLMASELRPDLWTDYQRS